MHPAFVVPLPLLVLGLAPLALLAACQGGEADSTGGNGTLREVPVVEGTANDSMVDLDAVATLGTSVVPANESAGTASARLEMPSAPANEAVALPDPAALAPE